MAPRENDPEEIEIDDWDMIRAMELMRGYHARWYAETKTFEIIGVEHQFIVPLVNPATGRPSQTFQLGGKMDVLIRKPGDLRKWIVEHKTSSQDIAPTSHYWPKLRLDGQVSTYFEGARGAGHEIAGCVYDVIRKPGLRPKRATPEDARRYTKGTRCKPCAKLYGGDFAENDVAGHPSCVTCLGSGWKERPRLVAGTRTEDETLDEYAVRIRAAIIESPETFYQRGDIVRLDDTLHEHGVDRWADARALRDSQLQNAHPTNPDACETNHSLCEYWAVCTGTASIDDDTLYQIGKQHSELDLEEEVA
jgi:hypothetical protein